MMSSRGKFTILFAALVLGSSNAALAHTSARAFILLLPTKLYMFGGALVVALSFVAMALMPMANLRAIEDARWRLGRLIRWRTEGWSLLPLLLVSVLVAAGQIGSPDPRCNPRPLAGRPWVFPTEGTAAAERLAGVPAVRSVVSEGCTHTLRGEGDDFLTHVITLIAREGIPVKGFRTEVPTLEDVFLKLTGHGVRD